MSEKSTTTRITVDFDSPPEGGTDWERLAAVTDEEIMANAETDPDCRPFTKEELTGFRRAPSARRAREACGMTQEGFAEKFGLSIGTVRDWEQDRHVPDRAARALLRIIEKYPVEAQAAMLPRRAVKPAADEQMAPATRDFTPVRPNGSDPSFVHVFPSSPLNVLVS